MCRLLTLFTVISLESWQAQAGVACPLRDAFATVPAGVAATRVLPRAAGGGGRRIVPKYGRHVRLKVDRAVTKAQVSKTPRETDKDKKTHCKSSYFFLLLFFSQLNN
jgi:hypothetical protein